MLITHPDVDHMGGIHAMKALCPQAKFYCGTYQILLDLTRHADVRYVRVKWAAQRWGKGDNKPLFGFYVFAQEMKEHLLAVGA